MRENLDKKLIVEDFARQCSISTSHFSTTFRKQTGISPMDYFIHLKEQRACQLLDLTNTKIKDIAEHVGYEDPYYFSRIFQKVIGTSPSKWKEIKKG